jgi:hypothetical protein
MLATLDHADLRPRNDGYIRFQNEAGAMVHGFLRNGEDCRGVLGRMEEALGAENTSGML